MDDWKLIWNSFCDEVAASVQKNNLEKVFEEDIARDFFTTLGWNRFKKELKEQYSVKFATATHRADFALFTLGKDTPEIIIELKRPKKKKEEKDANQLIDYMRQEACSYGVLLLGSKLEIYYIDYSTPKHEATLVETIKYQHDNEAAHQFMEVLNRGEYTSAKMLEYCHKRVKVNKSVEYWCSEDGKTEILNMIVERSQLPEHLLETLRSTLVVDVNRKDGLTPVIPQPVTTPSVPKANVSPYPMPSVAKDHKVWMISANPKFFDHKSCFDEYGVIFWNQYFNYAPGDTGYIYVSKPVKRLVYKFVVLDSELQFSEEVERQKKYYTSEIDYLEMKKHNRLFKIKKIGESVSDKMSIEKLQHFGMKKGPQGAMILSDSKYESLLSYIENNF